MDSLKKITGKDIVVEFAPNKEDYVHLHFGYVPFETINNVKIALPEILKAKGFKGKVTYLVTEGEDLPLFTVNLFNAPLATGIEYETI